jgi:hypothetical protein
VHESAITTANSDSTQAFSCGATLIAVITCESAHSLRLEGDEYTFAAERGFQRGHRRRATGCRDRIAGKLTMSSQDREIGHTARFHYVGTVTLRTSREGGDWEPE